CWCWGWWGVRWVGRRSNLLRISRLGCLNEGCTWVAVMVKLKCASSQGEGAGTFAILCVDGVLRGECSLCCSPWLPALQSPSASSPSVLPPNAGFGFTPCRGGRLHGFAETVS